MDTRCRFNLVALLWLLLAFPAFGQNQRAQSFTGTVGVTGAVLRVIGGATFDWGNTLLVDGVNGDNSTAARGNGAKPFKDPFAAKNAASAGDIIVVRRGTYNTNDLWKAGITYYFEPGAMLTFTDSGAAAARGLFDDRADPGTTNIVAGYGTFRHIQVNFTGNMKGAFVVTNSASRLYATGRRIEYDGGVSDNIAAFALENGTNYIEFDEVESLGTGGSGVFFRNGFSSVNIDYNVAFAYCLYAKEITNSTGTLFFQGKYWKQHPSASAQSAIFMEPNFAGMGNTNFYINGQLGKLESVQGNVVAYAGVVYLTIGEGFSTGLNVLHEISYSTEYHLNAQKLTGSLGPLGRTIWQMPLHTGSAVIRVEDLRHRDPTDPAVVFDGTGTVSIEGQYIRSENSKGIQINSNGVYRIKNFRIDTTLTDSTNNNPLYLSANATNVFLENVILQAPPSAESIRGTNTIAIAGTLQVNNLVASTIKYSGGILLQNTNLIGFGNADIAGLITGTGGGNFKGTTGLTSSSPFTVNGALAIPRFTNALLNVDVTTNLYSFFNFPSNTTVTFSGTALNGARLQVDILNTNTTNVVISFPSSRSVAQGLASITTVTVGTNSQVSCYFYRIGTGEWQFRSEGKDAFTTQFLNPSAGQIVSIGGIVDNQLILSNVTAGAGSGDVTAASTFGTDNVLIRSDGTGKGVQSSGVTLDDSNNLGSPGRGGFNEVWATNRLVTPKGAMTGVIADFSTNNYIVATLTSNSTWAVSNIAVGQFGIVEVTNTTFTLTWSGLTAAHFNSDIVPVQTLNGISLWIFRNNGVMTNAAHQGYSSTNLIVNGLTFLNNTATLSNALFKAVNGSTVVRQMETNGLFSYFGSGSVSAGTTVYVVGGAGTFVTLTNYADRITNGTRFDAVIFGRITNTAAAGYYDLSAFCTIGLSNSFRTMRLSIFTNDVAANIMCDGGGTNSIITMSASAVRFLPANCGVDVRITDNGAANQFTNRHAQLNVKQL